MTTLSLVQCFDQGQTSILRLYKHADGRREFCWQSIAEPTLPSWPVATRKFIGGPVIFNGEEYLPAIGPNVFD